MFSKAIVGYLDILGYQDLVTLAIGPDLMRDGELVKHSDESLVKYRDEELVKHLEKLFFLTSIDKIKDYGKMLLADIVEGGPEKVERHRDLVKNIRVRNNADSFIFTLPVPEVGQHNQETCDFIESYFLSMTMFIVHFIAQMGYLLRGGISIGNHYESERKHQLFVFSEAHNRAVKLESEKAVNPRIVMDKHLQLYFEQVSYPYIDRYFYEAQDGCYCLDFYYAISLSDNRKEEILTLIKNSIRISIERNFGKAKELGKLINFAKFHNNKVTGAIVNLPHLSFNIKKYEEQLRRLNSA
jgi:hypothetical protein